MLQFISAVLVSTPEYFSCFTKEQIPPMLELIFLKGDLWTLNHDK